MKCACEIFKDLKYFIYEKTHQVFFRFSFRAFFSLILHLIYVNIHNGVSKCETKHNLKHFTGKFY